MCLCEVAAWCKMQGMSLWDRMISMYETYGYFKEEQYTMTLKGIEGGKKIAAIMDKLRNNPPKTFGEKKVLRARDYKTGRVVDMSSHAESGTGLPTSNVVYFELTDGAWCCARPSGTEPKIKFYMGVRGDSLEDAKMQVEALTEAVKALI